MIFTKEELTATKDALWSILDAMYQGLIESSPATLAEEPISSFDENGADIINTQGALRKVISELMKEF